MSATRSITVEYVRKILDYDPLSGDLIWKERSIEHFKTAGARATWNTRYAGTKAGTVDSHGYMAINLSGKQFRSHRLIWFWMTGVWPDGGIDIDHRDNNRRNNKWTNLRLATRSQNLANSKAKASNTSGVKNVFWSASLSKWCARLRVDGRRLTIGYFDDLESARVAMASAIQKYHGEFGRAA